MKGARFSSSPESTDCKPNGTNHCNCAADAFPLQPPIILDHLGFHGDLSHTALEKSGEQRIAQELGRCSKPILRVGRQIITAMDQGESSLTNALRSAEIARISFKHETASATVDKAFRFVI
mmetsp:Transcript_24920/g.72069  ORF Transcript_24920/g.72069 Transcript_24920/m.72069 type:complete len:121 (-) Transcript_24920:983-1345(-)